MKIAMSKLKMLFWLFRSLNFWTPVSQDDSCILEVFGPENTLIQVFFFASTNVLKISLWPKTYNMPLLRIPGVMFASKVEICKLVMFCHKYLIWRQVFFSKFNAEAKKIFYNFILVIFSLKNVNRTPYLKGNIQLSHLLCKTLR